MPLYNVRAPALPLSPFEYDQRQQDQFQNALRLYFNRLDNFNTQMANNVNSQNVLQWVNAGSGMWSG
jgi:hypothetical protein